MEHFNNTVLPDQNFIEKYPIQHSYYGQRNFTNKIICSGKGHLSYPKGKKTRMMILSTNKELILDKLLYSK